MSTPKPTARKAPRAFLTAEVQALYDRDGRKCTARIEDVRLAFEVARKRGVPFHHLGTVRGQHLHSDGYANANGALLVVFTAVAS